MFWFLQYEKSEREMHLVVCFVLCFVRSCLATKLQNPESSPEVQVPVRPESGRLKHCICVQPKADRICPAPKGNLEPKRGGR